MNPQGITMNETPIPPNDPDVPTLNSVHPFRTADASNTSDGPRIADSDRPVAAAVGLLEQAVQGAHTTLDRLAEGAKPTVQELSERAASAEDALLAKSDQLREAGDEWVESVRTSVRDNPLAAIAAALALGLLLARISR
jgi:ElaB/YqjD/DUF883 family membrane-anchored ribosome-binding protein